MGSRLPLATGTVGEDRPQHLWPEAALAAAVVVGYAIGSGRSFTDDEAYTVANFVVGLPLFGPVTQPTNINNHPLLSVLDQVVHRVLDSTDEVAMRMVPIAAAALTVAVVFGVLRRRTGAIAAVSGAVVLATNPMYLEHARLARGYSLAALGTTIATVLLLRTVSRDQDSRSDLIYVFACGLAVAAHLHSLLVILFHVLVVWDRGRLSRRWMLNWTAAAAIGALGYAAMLEQLLVEADDGLWRPGFPADALRALLGGTTLTAVVLLAVLALGADRSLRRLIVLGVAAIGPPVAIFWLVVQPKDLYPRFLLWALPLVALAVGKAVGTDWRLAIPVMVVAVLSVSQVSDSYTVDAHAWPAAAAIAAADAAGGGRPCALNQTGPMFRAYVPDIRSVWRLDQLDDCTTAFALHRLTDADLVDAASARYPCHTTLPALTPGRVFSRSPVAPATVCR